jgi:hypothetical protein
VHIPETFPSRLNNLDMISNNRGMMNMRTLLIWCSEFPKYFRHICDLNQPIDISLQHCSSCKSQTLPSTRYKAHRFIPHGPPVLPALSSSRESSHSYHVLNAQVLRRPYCGRNMQRLMPLTVSLCGCDGVD